MIVCIKNLQCQNMKVFILTKSSPLDFQAVYTFKWTRSERPLFYFDFQKACKLYQTTCWWCRSTARSSTPASSTSRRTPSRSTWAQGWGRNPGQPQRPPPRPRTLPCSETTRKNLSEILQTTFPVKPTQLGTSTNRKSKFDSTSTTQKTRSNRPIKTTVCRKTISDWYDESFDTLVALTMTDLQSFHLWETGGQSTHRKNKCLKNVCATSHL